MNMAAILGGSFNSQISTAMSRRSISKLQAAERQIRAACDLHFLHGDLLSLMALAGAAEEYRLGPISVKPELQHRGIGRALMERGIVELRKIGAAGMFWLATQRSTSVSGLRTILRPCLRGSPEFFLCLSLGTASAQGTVQFHQAFQATG